MTKAFTNLRSTPPIYLLLCTVLLWLPYQAEAGKGKTDAHPVGQELNFPNQEFDILKAKQANCFQKLPLLPYNTALPSTDRPVEQLKKNEAFVTLYTTTGKTLFSKVVVNDQEVNTVNFMDPTNQLKPGIYLVTGSTDHCIVETNKKIRIN